MPNHLLHEISPYLIQHANNPVNWYPWGDIALQKAKIEDKPIFLSIGYAACHWCHVMAHESFEDPQTAEIMNANFVNIKVDREERPDLDNIYMAATIALTGSGGWPMSIFLTPDLQPFYAGTYFPPEPHYNMPSFRQVLISLAESWHNQREKINDIGQQLSNHLLTQAQTDRQGLPLNHASLEIALENLLKSYDWGYGGWGSAPKFPQPMVIEFLLRSAVRSFSLRPSQSGSPDPKLLKPAIHALHAMSRGGMYDVVGGGFARYSTDQLWRVPHFEKMLSDNAQLGQAYLRAWQLSGEPAFLRIITTTLGFVERELTSPDGGYYSSLDADSDGEEGKYYLWSASELKDLLGDEYPFFETAYGITEAGNWEGKTVLQRSLDDATLSARFKLSPENVAAKLDACHSKLLAERQKRVPPATDDKILTVWNALMLQTYAEAARIFREKYPSAANHYLDMATRNAHFLVSALRTDDKLRRSWRGGKSGPPAFLEDYASLVLAFLELYQTNFDLKWFLTARELADEMIALFIDPAGGFFDTPADATPLLLRPKDLQDNATPCGNALAAEALLRLAAFTDDPNYRRLAEEGLGLISSIAPQYPTAFSRWLSVAAFAIEPVKQIALVGKLENKDSQSMLQTIWQAYRPQVVVAASSYPPPEGSPVLLENRPLINNMTTAYVCEGFVCQLPVNTTDELMKQL